jgi:hypothetical protein
MNVYPSLAVECNVVRVRGQIAGEEARRTVTGTLYI